MYWLKKLKLHEADKDSLYNGKWLTDNIIDAAQALLRKAYHHIGGLEPVCLGQTLQFTVQRGEFVQILNVSNSHWVTLSNIGCKPGTVNIFDSIPSPLAQKSRLLQYSSVKKKKSNSSLSLCRSNMELLTVECLLLLLQLLYAQEKTLQKFISFNIS